MKQQFNTNIITTVATRTGSVLLASTCLLFASGVTAQTPTAEQIKVFQSLPASQQQALAQQYGFSLPGGGGGASQSYESPKVIEPRPETAQQSTQTLEEALTKEEDKELKRFGLDLFSGSPTTFAPISDVPVPATYKVGPGDEIVIQLFGKDNTTHRLRVNRKGVINFPSLGPIQVAGLSFSSLRESLTKKIDERIIGVRSDITLGELRTMQIFVLGDAYKPGAYSVSALTTISQAVYYSGGFGEQGSLRKVQLKRDGRIVKTLDMYDLLLRGDTSNDIRLQPGDVVFIAPVQNTITIDGEIQRPAIYEFNPGETYNDLIGFAGGATANAYRDKVEVKRYSGKGKREIVTLNLNELLDQKIKVRNGDDVMLLAQNDEISDFISIQGAVKYPGYIEWKKNLRIADVFSSIDQAVNKTADVHYALVVREINQQRDIEVLQFDLANALLQPKSSDNLTLQLRDRILIFNRYSGQELTAVKGEFSEIKEDQGKVKGLQEAQDRADAEEQLNQAATQIEQIDTSKLEQITLLLQGEAITEEELETLLANTRPVLLAPILLQLELQSKLGLPPEVAEVTGAVKYPGKYPVPGNMTVSSLIKAAGGLNAIAFTRKAELARSVIDSDSEQASIDIMDINLRNAIKGKADDDAIIEPQDRLNILEKPNAKLAGSITLQGEVKFPGKYTVRQGETLAELLVRAGGLTDYAHQQGAIFTREALRVKEEELLRKYAEDLRSETVKKTFRANGSSPAFGSPDDTLNFIDKAVESKALGRMVVQLDRILEKDASADFIVEDGDFLFIPTFRNTISLVGEVQVSITYLLDSSLGVEEYLNKAGGIKKQADEDRIFVMRADGSVYKPYSGFWFGNSSEKLKPGDTIVVPLDTHYRDSLDVWTAATQILYQSGIAWKSISE
ncbi:SLBB domain-containing protein [Vibrio sp.]|nr:SLBB domain-containing protein [Vibrio sp.]